MADAEAEPTAGRAFANLSGREAWRAKSRHSQFRRAGDWRQHCMNSVTTALSSSSNSRLNEALERERDGEFITITREVTGNRRARRDRIQRAGAVARRAPADPAGRRHSAPGRHGGSPFA